MAKEEIKNEPTQSHWHVDAEGIWCDHCRMYYYFDGTNLNNGEALWQYCPDCGAFMVNGKSMV